MITLNLAIDIYLINSLNSRCVTVIAYAMHRLLINCFNCYTCGRKVQTTFFNNSINISNLSSKKKKERKKKWPSLLSYGMLRFAFCVRSSDISKTCIYLEIIILKNNMFLHLERNFSSNPIKYSAVLDSVQLPTIALY